MRPGGVYPNAGCNLRGLPSTLPSTLACQAGGSTHKHLHACTALEKPRNTPRTRAGPTRRLISPVDPPPGHMAPAQDAHRAAAAGGGSTCQPGAIPPCCTCVKESLESGGNRALATCRLGCQGQHGGWQRRRWALIVRSGQKRRRWFAALIQIAQLECPSDCPGKQDHSSIGQPAWSDALRHVATAGAM